MADIADKQLKRLRSLLDEAETSMAAAKELIISLVGDDKTVVTTSPELVAGKDGKTYLVPPNYASKSKLVQGDILKLAIGDDGKFTYKQIGPIPRKTVLGTLIYKDGQYVVEVDKKQYKVLLASITYFKAHPGDQISVILPEDDKDVEWAAIEAAI